MPTVRPLSFLDTHVGTEASVLSVGYIFSGRVNPAKVAAAVDKISKIWPELAGEIYRDEATKEILLRIPTVKEAKIEFVVKEFSQSLSSVHKRTIATSAISIQPAPHAEQWFKLLSTPPFQSCEEFLSASPRKGISLQLSLFEDASIFTFFYPHIRMDASANHELMTALIALLSDPDAVLEGPLEGDPFAGLLEQSAMRKPSEAPPPWQLRTPEQMRQYMEAAMRDAPIDGEVECRRVYFPRAEIEKMREECIEALKTASGGDVGNGFISEGDVMTAWLWKNLYGSSTDEPDRPVRLMYTADIRPHLPKLFPKSIPYFGNAWLIQSMHYTPTRSELASVSLGELAGTIRRGILQHMTKEKIKDYILWKAQHADAGHLHVPFKAEERFLFPSSWLKFRIGSLTLPASAMITEGPGAVVDVYCDIPGAQEWKGAGQFLYKDAAGGVIFHAYLGKKQWEESEMGKYVLRTAEKGTEPVVG